MRAFYRPSPKPSDLIPDNDLWNSLIATAQAKEQLLELHSMSGETAQPGEAKDMTLTLLGLFKRGASISELLSIRECRTILLNPDGRVPSRRCLSMRMLRYCRQSCLKRRFVHGEYRYEITEKGLLYMPRDPLWRKVEDIFRRVRADPRYKSLIPNQKKDQALEKLFIGHAKKL